MKNNSAKETHDRKLDHIRLSLKKDVQARKKSTGFYDISFIHESLPELSLHEIDISTEFLGKKLDAPIVISAITGGHPESKEINKILGQIAQEYNVIMEVGSQRAGIEDSSLSDTYSIVRDVAKDAFLVSNIGAGQLSEGWGINEAENAINMINADALAIHLNPLHEIVQPEGNVDYSNVLSKIKEISKTIKTPLIGKETGAGFSRETASKLFKSGIQALQIEGAGGTSFAAVEAQRSIEKDDELKEHLGELFWDWGVPTAVSTAESSYYNPRKLIISSGGIRTGVEIAKAIGLGASLGGLAFPFLFAYDRNKYDGVKYLINRLILELKTTMFLVGAKNLSELKEVNLIIRGKTAEWLNLRGIDLNYYANRK
ncbi:MAG: type 2 isopentenyl-diphosphate Delta-isomerase [Candidatus Ranarchaeia archaeon]